MPSFGVLLTLLYLGLLLVFAAPVQLQDNKETEFAYTIGNNNFYYTYAGGADQIYLFSQFAIAITISTYIPMASPVPFTATVTRTHPAWPSGNAFNVEELLKNLGLNLRNQGWGGIFYKYGDGCAVHCDWSSVTKSHTILIKLPTLYPTRNPTAFTPLPTEFPSVSPSVSPTAPTMPTVMPSQNPSPNPTQQPSRYPSSTPTSDPTPHPTPMPTARPTFPPTANPSGSPTNYPSVTPSKHPSVSPSKSPSHSPTRFPSISPTKNPTFNPTHFPTASPSMSPSTHPTNSPSVLPTVSPTQNPTHLPTVSPSRSPSISPTRNPTTFPTRNPTHNPSVTPTAAPSANPSIPPTASPSRSPTKDPTLNPSVSPTLSPTQNPTRLPTVSPSRSPTVSPTRNPSTTPTLSPSALPTTTPTRNPSTSPTVSPTSNPSVSPTNFPSVSPTVAPSAAPTYYINPYCPRAHALEVMGVQTNNLALTEYAECRTNDPSQAGSRAIDYQGKLTCDAPFSCCLCQQIYCGASGFGCSRLIMGVSAGIGVPNIYIQSTSALVQRSNPYSFANGAAFYCDSSESCKNSNIEGAYIARGHCNGQFGCQNSRILIEPAENMIFKCDGYSSCAASDIEINIAVDSPVANIESLTFLGQQSAIGATVTIRNSSPHAVLIKNFECASTSCMDTIWRFEGLIFLQSCDLVGLQNLYSLPPVMQSCILGTPFNPQPI